MGTDAQDAASNSEQSQVRLKLKQIYETGDISFAGDGSLIKKQVKEGTGWQHPTDLARVQLLVEEATDGTSPLVGFSPATLEFSVGNGEVCDALETVVATMRRGERAVLSCTDVASCREAKLGLQDITAAGVAFTVELTGFEPSKDVATLSEVERIAWGAERKDAGARFFKSGSYWLALARYQKVVDLFSYVDNLSTDGRNKAVELRRLCELNSAACLLKLERFAVALAMCDRVLAQDRENSKALFRRAQARLGLGQPRAAVADLRRVVLEDQQNREARVLLKEATERTKVQEDQKDAPLYSKMCEALGKGPIPETFWLKYRDFGDGFTHPREEEAYIEELQKTITEHAGTEKAYQALKEAKEKYFGPDRPANADRRDCEMRLNACLEVQSEEFSAFKKDEEKAAGRETLAASQEDDATFLQNKAAWPDDDSDAE